MRLIFSCDDHVTERYLEGDLSPLETTMFEEHLDTCERCRTKLNDITTSHEFWRTTKHFLSSVDELPALPPKRKADVSFETETIDQTMAGQDVLRDIPLQPSNDPHMLGRFGGYEISGVVGRGGMGVVIKGWDQSLDRYVAIKVLSPTFAHLEPARQRFAREAKAAAGIVHDNIIAIYGVDQCNGLPYLVMPYVQGESLQKRIDREAPLPFEVILEYALQIARGLQAAHAQGVIHRDIKPANILLPQNVSRILITDFGLARAADDATLTNSGLIAGTPAYMSPEQARGDGMDARSDLFSLGSVIYAMTCGHPPFQAETSYGIMRRIIDERPTAIKQKRPDAPYWFQQVIDQLLAKEPQQRFLSAALCAEHLELCLKHLREPGALPPPKLRTKKSTVHWLSHCVGILFCLAVLVLSLWQLNVRRDTKPATTQTPVPYELRDFNSDGLTNDIDEIENQLQQLERELEQ